MSDNENKKIQFNEALAYLVETANINSGKVSLNDIHKTFEGIIEDANMYQLIYDYLLENKIVIEDYISTQKENPSTSSDSEETHTFKAKEHEKEKVFVKMYLDEVATIEKMDEANELKLVNEIITLTKNSGNLSEADKRLLKKKTDMLIENNLYIVTEISNAYSSSSVTSGDLLQEGNLGLIEGVRKFISDNDILENLSIFKNYINSHIKETISQAISEQDSASRLGEHLVNRANSLDRESVNLTNELGRTPTLSELSKALSISEDEASEIMKMSINALNSDGT